MELDKNMVAETRITSKVIKSVLSDMKQSRIPKVKHNIGYWLNDRIAKKNLSKHLKQKNIPGVETDSNVFYIKNPQKILDVVPAEVTLDYIDVEYGTTRKAGFVITRDLYAQLSDVKNKYTDKVIEILVRHGIGGSYEHAKEDMKYLKKLKGIK